MNWIVHNIFIFTLYIVMDLGFPLGCQLYIFTSLEAEVAAVSVTTVSTNRMETTH